MKLDYKRTIYIGMAFLGISAFWQLYDVIIPLILENQFALDKTWTGLVMSLDNISFPSLEPFQIGWIASTAVGFPLSLLGQSYPSSVCYYCPMRPISTPSGSLIWAWELFCWPCPFPVHLPWPSCLT